MSGVTGFSLAPVFGSGMVLQRDRPIQIWGSDGDGSAVTARLGDLEAVCLPRDGQWSCQLPPCPAGRGLCLTVSQGQERFTLEDVAVGDVWLAGGQSNMEFFLRYEAHWPEAQALPFNPDIRMYTCPRIAFAGQKPYQAGVGRWFSEQDDCWGTFSSLGYWFARYLQPELGVPVGIVSCNWGGTSASAWLPASDLEDGPLQVYLEDYQAACTAMAPEECRRKSAVGWTLQSDPAHQADWANVLRGIDRPAQLERMRRCAGNPAVPMGPWNKNRPGCLYEYMVRPILPFAFKGVLWYQGENDVHHAELYSTLFAQLVGRWRSVWGEGLPFLFVQLAPFQQWMDLNGERFPELRCQQELAEQALPRCWMTSIMDLGMRYDIHPKEKREIGRRLALSALGQVYGLREPCGSPGGIAGTRLPDGRLLIRFADCARGLTCGQGLERDFVVTQEETYKSVLRAEVGQDSVILWCRGLDSTPVQIAFAQVPYAEISLRNALGFSAKPFLLKVP